MNLAMFRSVFVQASLLRRSQGSVVAAYVVLVLTILAQLVAAVFLFFGYSVAKLGTVVLFIAGIQALLVWSPLIQVVPHLLTPHYVHLVPRVQLETKQVIMTSWFVVVMFFALGFGLLLGEYIRSACIAMLMLGGLTLLAIRRAEGVVPYLLAYFLALDRSAFAGVNPELLKAFIILSAIITSIYAYFRLFPKGEQHWRSAAAAEKTKNTSWGFVSVDDRSRFAISRGLYGAILARDCRQATGNDGRLLWHALGPGAHWSRPVLYWLLFVVLSEIAIHILPEFGISTDFMKVLVSSTSSMLIILGQVWHFQNVAIRIDSTKTEQSLVYLTPRIPQDKEVNRLFVERVLWHSAVLFGLVMAISLFVSSTDVDMVRAMLYGPVAMLHDLMRNGPFVLISAGMLNWVSTPGNPASTRPALLLLAPLLVLMAISIALNSVVRLPEWVLPLVSFVLAGALLWRTILKVLNGPKVFPMAVK